MSRTLAAVLLAAVVGAVAPVASVAGDEPFGPDCPLTALAFESQRKPPPGFTQRQWDMLWELGRCFAFIPDDTFNLHGDVHIVLPLDCNLFEYLEGGEVAALVCD